MSRVGIEPTTRRLRVPSFASVAVRAVFSLRNTCNFAAGSSARFHLRPPVRVSVRVSVCASVICSKRPMKLVRTTAPVDGNGHEPEPAWVQTNRVADVQPPASFPAFSPP